MTRIASLCMAFVATGLIGVGCAAEPPTTGAAAGALGASVVDGCFEVRGTVFQVQQATGSYAGVAAGQEMVVRYEYDLGVQGVVAGQTTTWPYPVSGNASLDVTSASIGGTSIASTCSHDPSYETNQGAIDRFNVDFGANNNSWSAVDFDWQANCFQTANTILNGCAEGTIEDFPLEPAGPADISDCSVRIVQLTAIGSALPGQLVARANIDSITNCGAVDSDGDGVLDGDDVCPDTVLPESPIEGLGTNRLADIDGDGTFETTHPQESPLPTFTLADTGGCSCAQIVERAGLGAGHRKFGCSSGAIEEWIEGL